jgi:hypothetical protein
MLSRLEFFQYNQERGLRKTLVGASDQSRLRDESKESGMRWRSWKGSRNWESRQRRSCECSTLRVTSIRQGKAKEQRWRGCALSICDGKSISFSSGDFHGLVTNIGSTTHFRSGREGCRLLIMLNCASFLCVVWSSGKTVFVTI